MAITRQDILNAYSGVYNNRQKAQEMERQYRASRTKEDDIADRINAMSLDEQAGLADALKTGNIGNSTSASAANEVYTKAMSQADLVAQQFGKKPGTEDYNDFVNNYAQQFYDENIGLGVVSYQQAAEMNKLYQQMEANKKDEAYRDWLRSKGGLYANRAGHVSADKWMDDFTGWLRQSSNPRTQDIASHLSASGTVPYDTSKTVESSNPYSARSSYEAEFEDYYNNMPKG